MDVSSIVNFGAVAAEDEPVLDYFVETSAVKEISEGAKFLVLGRKGSGKTALVRYFNEKKTKRSCVNFFELTRISLGFTC